MSEQYPSDVTPPEEIPPIPQMTDTPPEAPLPAMTAADPSRAAPRWFAPAWFLLGILVGIVGFAAYNRFIGNPAAPVAQTESIDPNTAMKTAAREGVLEAIATLQAGGGQQPSAQQPQSPQTVSNSAFTVRPANRLGSPDAKVTIFEFADYQCPFCKRYHDSIGPDLLKQYVDTGKVDFVYKHSAFLGQESVWAAQAAECAADQGKFWEYHDLLFSKQNGENVGTFTKEKLIGYAKDLGLDSTQFDPCLQNDLTLQRVISDTQEGRNVGVSGTPTFFINGTPLVGAQPLSAFQTQIDALLKQ